MTFASPSQPISPSQPLSTAELIALQSQPWSYLTARNFVEYFERLFCSRCRFPVDTSTRQQLAEYLEPRAEAFEKNEDLWHELQPVTSRWLEQVADQASLLCEIRDDDVIRSEFLTAARQIVSGWSSRPNSFLG